MELRAIVLMIIKIVISIPTVFFIIPHRAHGSALMGGHIDNRANGTIPNHVLDSTNSNKNLAINDSDKLELNITEGLRASENAEEIPYPSPLVVPGYNLPETIFNKGKPFYLEKDPLTGQIDFLSKTSDLNTYDDYEYADENAKFDEYSKVNIDRKDNNIGSHKLNDANQLTPTLYSFLNLPVKYNPDKYIYPLISSSYANTKVQGNVNRFQNHNNYSGTTYKPAKSPLYHAKQSYYTKPYKTTPKYETTSTKTTTSTTEKPTTEIYLTSEVNLMNSPMNDPSFEIVNGSNKADSVYLTTKEEKPSTTTTEKTFSFLEQLYMSFHDDEMTTRRPLITTATSKTTTTTVEYKDEYDLSEVEDEEDPYHQNILTGSNMEHHYNEDYDADVTDSIAVENKQHVFLETTTMKVITTPKNIISSTTEIIDIVTVKPEVVTIHNTTGFRPSQIVEVFGEEDGADYYNPNYKILHNSTLIPKIKDENLQTYTITTTIPKEISNEPHILNTPPSILTPPKVTSMPLGDNHVTHNNHPPIIVATQNLREQLNNEKVIPRPFMPAPTKHGLPPVPSSSKIHIAPHQDTASFVIGHQQTVGNQYVATASKESPFEGNPFRPYYEQGPNQNYVSYSIQANSEEIKTPPSNFDLKPASINIQPIRNSEASLAIGVPIDLIQGKPGQVMDEDINNEKIKFPKGSGPKIVFPEVEPEEPQYNINHDTKPNNYINPQNKEILKLSSKPMLHQLPSDLTPPSEIFSQPRPPYDPRPGHFHSGRPEYARPPRPNEVYKRMDKLPNILPQFRPNMKMNHRYDPPNKNFYRQPLLERPSNRPIGFFEKLQPPPPPKNLQHLRKIPPLEQEKLKPAIAEDRIMNEGYKKTTPDQYMFYQTPPKIVLSHRRKHEEELGIETLQMIQAKTDKIEKVNAEVSSSFHTNLRGKDSLEKPLYVVYPVNTPPLKLDAIDTNKKESVVIGTRAELPLPPSKIQESNYDLNDSKNQFDFNFHERHDSPILKPHPRPHAPIKSDFPYPMERPDPSLITTPEIGNSIENTPKFESNNWNRLDDMESRIITGSKINSQDPISVKLKTYTEKPIAVAYTPTEPPHEKYSLPNYANHEIHPEYNAEFPVSAVMNTHSRIDAQEIKPQDFRDKNEHKNPDIDVETTHVPQLDFQAPFQPSINIDNITNGWLAVKEKSKTGDDGETTTISQSTTSEFNIENFKPQLIGGFKPLYDFIEDDATKNVEVKERQE